MLEVGRLAQETTDGQRQLAVDGRHARIVTAAVVHELALPGERRVGIYDPGDRRGNHAPLVVAEVAKTLVLLVVRVDAVEQRAVLVHRSRAVDRVTLQSETAELHAARLHRVGQRLLGDQVDRAGGLAGTVNPRAGALQDFHAIDIGEIAGRVRGIEKAVLAEVARGDQETAEDEGVQPQVIVGLLDCTRNVAKHVVHGEHLLIAEHRLGHHADRGRHVDLRHVDERARGR